MSYLFLFLAVSKMMKKSDLHWEYIIQYACFDGLELSQLEKNKEAFTLSLIASVFWRFFLIIIPAIHFKMLYIAKSIYFT